MTADKTRFSLVPFEYQSLAHRRAAEYAVIARYGVAHVESDVLADAYMELCGHADCRLYHIPPFTPASRVFVLFDAGSACLVFESRESDWPVTESRIRDELQGRAQLHGAVIRHGDKSPLYDVVEALTCEASRTSSTVPTVNYVFTYFCFDVPHGHLDNCDRMLSLMAEPSLIDLDDSNYDATRRGLSFDDAKREFRSELRDCDVSSASRTYITWATIVAVLSCDSNTSDRSKLLLLSLELRLQIAWNRCFVLSRIIDGIFMGNRVYRLADLYLSFSTAIDSVRSLQSATASTRASRFLDAMVQSSRLSTECDRLQQKIGLLEKFLIEKQSSRNDKYQRVIQLLLVLLAIGQIVPLFFPIPLTRSYVVGDVALGALLIAAAVAILRAGRVWR